MFLILLTNVFQILFSISCEAQSREQIERTEAFDKLWKQFDAAKIAILKYTYDTNVDVGNLDLTWENTINFINCRIRLMLVIIKTLQKIENSSLKDQKTILNSQTVLLQEKIKQLAISFMEKMEVYMFRKKQLKNKVKKN